MSSVVPYFRFDREGKIRTFREYWNPDDLPFLLTFLNDSGWVSLLSRRAYCTRNRRRGCLAARTRCCWPWGTWV